MFKPRLIVIWRSFDDDGRFQSRVLHVRDGINCKVVDQRELMNSRAMDEDVRATSILTP
jgi:hypothetical protein